MGGEYKKIGMEFHALYKGFRIYIMFYSASLNIPSVLLFPHYEYFSILITIKTSGYAKDIYLNGKEGIEKSESTEISHRGISKDQ